MPFPVLPIAMPFPIPPLVDIAVKILFQSKRLENCFFSALSVSVLKDLCRDFKIAGLQARLSVIKF